MHGQTTGHTDRLPGDVIGILTGQKRDDAGIVRRLAEAAHGNGTGQPVNQFPALFAIAGEEYTSMTAEEFASISPEDFESALGVWTFSQFDDNYEMGSVECNLEPNPLMKGRARAAHKAARIWQKLEFSTKSMNEYKALIDEGFSMPLKDALVWEEQQAIASAKLATSQLIEARRQQVLQRGRSEKPT